MTVTSRHQGHQEYQEDWGDGNFTAVRRENGAWRNRRRPENWRFARYVCRLREALAVFVGQVIGLAYATGSVLPANLSCSRRKRFAMRGDETRYEDRFGLALPR